MISRSRWKLGHMTYISVFAKSAGLSDKTGIFSFCPAETFNLSDKCPVILSKENNILTTNIPSVLQILICPAKDYSLSDSCPASVEKILRRLTFHGPMPLLNFFRLGQFLSTVSSDTKHLRTSQHGLLNAVI